MNKKMLRNLCVAGGALLVIAAVILMIIFIPSCNGNKPQEEKTHEIDYGTALNAYVNEDKLHCVDVVTNEKGEIENNSYGTLISYTPAQIEKISMETPQGNYTFLLSTPVDSSGNTGATVYTLEGFEEYDLATTNPSLLASAICKIEFSKVVDLKGEKSSDFGFDEPRATGIAYYSDSTHSKVILGADAAGGETCYIKFGDSDTIYLVNSENMAPLLYDVTDLFSTSINADKTSVADDSFTEIVLGGTHLSEKFVMGKNEDKALNCYYVLTSHNNAPVSSIEGSNIVGSIKSLNCKEVICVNPDQENLKELGLSEPFATVSTDYLYSEKTYDANGEQTGSEDAVLKVSLLASKPDAEGNVNLMEENGKLVYKIAASSVPWVSVTEDTLRSEYVFSPAYSALSRVDITAAGKNYSFELGTEEKDGATVVTVSLDGKKLSESSFYALCQDLALIELAGADDGTNTTGTALSVTYTYSTGRASDTVEFFSTDSQKVMTSLNGKRTGYVYKEQVDGLIANVDKLAKGQEISTVL